MLLRRHVSQINRVAKRQLLKGYHVFRPEDDPDRACKPGFDQQLMPQSRGNTISQRPGRTRDMQLYRPRDDRMIAGVCSGIARRFNLDPTIVRIAFVASLFLPGPQILIYLIAWLLMPDESTSVA
jgi:phage shock protein PspC (stress-responsive transcriptional regulator)